MKCSRYMFALTVLLWHGLLAGQPLRPSHMEADRILGRIRAIQTQLASPIDRNTFGTDMVRHNHEFEQLKDLVREFFLGQLTADPDMGRWQLRERLVQVLGTKLDSESRDHSHEPPYVFPISRAGERKTRAWAIAYSADAYSGLGGSRVVVESYVIDNGRARLAGRGGSEMDGHELFAEQLAYPLVDSTMLLLHGRLLWASGHELPASAMLYRVGGSGVKFTWRFDAPGLRFLRNEGERFVLEYHDERRHERHLPSAAVDRYSIDTGTGIPFRDLHQFVALPKP